MTAYFVFFPFLLPRMTVLGDCVGDALAGLTFSDMIVALRRIKNHTINMVEARNSSWESRREALRVLDVVRRNGVKPSANA